MEKLFRIRRKNEKGFTLLEYCAGAAIICGIVYAALTSMGSGISNSAEAIGTWADQRAADINNSQ